MNKAKLTDDIDLSAIREMEAQGMSRGEIAAALETTTATLARYLGPGKRGRRPGTIAVKRVQEEVKPKEEVPSLYERLQQEVAEGKRPAPKQEKTLKIKQRQTVLEGELGSYTIDHVNRTVTVETVIHGTPATLEDLRRVIRELQAVAQELGGETA